MNPKKNKPAAYPPPCPKLLDNAPHNLACSTIYQIEKAVHNIKDPPNTISELSANELLVPILPAIAKIVNPRVTNDMQKNTRNSINDNKYLTGFLPETLH